MSSFLVALICISFSLGVADDDIDSDPYYAGVSLLQSHAHILACENIAGTYDVPRSPAITITQSGCTINFTAWGTNYSTTLSGPSFTVPGWKEGTVQPNGDLLFADHHTWRKWSSPCVNVAGIYEVPHSKPITIAQAGCAIQFRAWDTVHSATIQGHSFTVPGWKEGAAQSNGDLNFADHHTWKRVCVNVAGTYGVPRSGEIIVEQSGCAIQFRASNSTYSATVDGNSLTVPGWGEGTVHPNGDLDFADHQTWVKLQSEIPALSSDEDAMTGRHSQEWRRDA